MISHRSDLLEKMTQYKRWSEMLLETINEFYAPIIMDPFRAWLRWETDGELLRFLDLKYGQDEVNKMTVAMTDDDKFEKLRDTFIETAKKYWDQKAIEEMYDRPISQRADLLEKLHKKKDTILFEVSFTYFPGPDKVGFRDIRPGEIPPNLGPVVAAQMKDSIRRFLFETMRGINYSDSNQYWYNIEDFDAALDVVNEAFAMEFNPQEYWQMESVTPASSSGDENIIEVYVRMGHND